MRYWPLPLDDKSFEASETTVLLLVDLHIIFSFYRLSVYTFSMAFLMEIMQHGTYTEAAILDVKKTVEVQALQYRNLYTP